MGLPLQMCDMPRGSPSGGLMTPESHLISRPFQLLARVFVKFTLRQGFCLLGRHLPCTSRKRARGNSKASLFQGLTSLGFLYFPMAYLPCHHLHSWELRVPTANLLLNPSRKTGGGLGYPWTSPMTERARGLPRGGRWGTMTSGVSTCPPTS